MTTGAHLRATLDRIANVIFNDLQLSLIRHRADVNRLGRSFALLEQARFFNYEIGKFFGDRFMHVTTLDRSACLSRVAESAPDSGTCSILEIGVFEHDHRILATELEHYRRQVFRGGFGD